PQNPKTPFLYDYLFSCLKRNKLKNQLSLISVVFSGCYSHSMPSIAEVTRWSLVITVTYVSGIAISNHSSSSFAPS
ncbi:MAG: hypothetical protein ACMG6E_08540, partial [Candidatus Roizmanbacteria bacterium]